MQKNKKIGSAVLAVVLFMVAFYIYSTNVTIQTTLAGYIQSDAEARIKKVYEKDINNLDQIYGDLTNENMR